MVRSDGIRVSLTAGDWLKIAISNATAVGVIIVSIWTKQAVIENELEHLKESLDKLELRLERQMKHAP